MPCAAPAPLVVLFAALPRRHWQATLEDRYVSEKDMDPTALVAADAIEERTRMPRLTDGCESRTSSSEGVLQPYETIGAT